MMSAASESNNDNANANESESAVERRAERAASARTAAACTSSKQQPSNGAVEKQAVGAYMCM